MWIYQQNPQTFSNVQIQLHFYLEFLYVLLLAKFKISLAYMQYEVANNSSAYRQQQKQVINPLTADEICYTIKCMKL